MKPTNWTNEHTQLPVESNIVVVRLPDVEYGSLDDVNLARARRLLHGVAKQLRPLYMIVDLSGVHYLGAALVGIVVSAWDDLVKHNRRLVLCGLNPYCARLFKTLHLDRLITVHATAQAALEAIEGQGGRDPIATDRVQASDVSWDPNLLRVDYMGHDAEPIRSFIVPSKIEDNEDHSRPVNAE